MGKDSRRREGKPQAKAGAAAPREFTTTQRLDLSKCLLHKLLEQGITVSSAPSLLRLLQKVKNYNLEGERLETTQVLPELGCKILLLLPKYDTEQPRLQLAPIGKSSS